MNITVHNPSKHDAVLGRGTLLGHSQLVQSVPPLVVVRKDLARLEAVGPRETDGTSPKDGRTPEPQHQESDLSQVNRGFGDEKTSFKTPVVVLGDLTESQQQMAMSMLEEEAESFSEDDDDDMGLVEGSQLNLEMSDNTPVQKTYS